MKNRLFLLALSPFLINIKACEDNDPKAKAVVEKVIEGRKVLSDSVEGKNIEAKLAALRTKFENELKKIDTDLEKEIKELQSRARTVDPESLEKDQERILRKRKERDVKAESSQEEFNRTAQRELGRFNAKLQEQVIQTAKSKNWDKVTLKESGEVIYVSDRLNGTNEIIKSLDTKAKQEKAEHNKKVIAAAAV